MSLHDTLDFLQDLSQHNEKAWFEANRRRYDAAREGFEDLLAGLIEALEPYDHLGDLAPKDCMFRINRDVRFSKDKSPYNPRFAADIGRGGRKAASRRYYLMIQPGDQSFFACGMHDPEPSALNNVRQHLARDGATFRAIIRDPAFVKAFGGLQGETLKTAPGGFSREHPDIDLLRYKEYLAMHAISDRDVTSSGLIARLVEVRHAMQPFLDWLEPAAAGA